MKYRRFGSLDWKVSALGFGAMRLPVIDGDRSKIDESEAIRMIRYAIDNGVNYIDTAYPYHAGNSEIVVGKALGDGYRQKIKLATKMPTWLVNSEADMNKYLDEQFARLKTDYIDFYLLHGLKRERFQLLRELNVFEWAEKKMDEGKFRHFGFSFHDEYDVFKKIVDSYDGWDLCQILYNYMDTDYQAGTKGLRYAASRGLAVVVMEPIAGGRLAINPLPQIQKIWDSAEVKKSLVEWALLWVWNHTEVSVALSGMSAMQHVLDNVEYADHSGPNTLTERDLAIITQAARKYRELGFVGCTNCGYCLPCPEDVEIGKIISFYNEYYSAHTQNDKDEVKKRYLEEILPENQAKNCERCGSCEEVCPQQLPISQVLQKAKNIFEGD